jgi:NADPH:quinone reductase-like Zn-dependent oxidoreductase
LVVGFPAGIPKLPLNLTLLKACDVRGVFWGAFAMREPEREQANVAQLLAWWSEGKIRPRIDRIFPLAEGSKAIQRLAAREVIGKVVVTFSGEIS